MKEQFINEWTKIDLKLLAVKIDEYEATRKFLHKPMNLEFINRDYLEKHKW